MVGAVKNSLNGLSETRLLTDMSRKKTQLTISQTVTRRSEMAWPDSGAAPPSPL